MDDDMNLKDPNYSHKVERYPNHKQWTVGITDDFRVYIQDDNFEYDARLYINGDFLDIELQERYARAIADVLNAAI
jgi:hypothetical protein